MVTIGTRFLTSILSRSLLVEPTFTYLTFDYFAEGRFLSDQQGNILAIRDAAGLEIEWSKGGEIYSGTVWGSWFDLNENGLRPFQDGSGLGACEDFDNNGRYDEVEYMGDHSDRYESMVGLIPKV